MTEDELQELEQLATFDGGELVTTSQIKLATAVLKLATEVRRLKQEKQDLWDELCHLEELAGMTE